MNPTQNNSLANIRLRRLLAITIPVLVLVGAVITLLAIHTVKTTSDVYLTAFASDAGISISQNSKTVVAVGTGSAHLRLQPGEYQVVASSAGKRGSTLINVQLHKTTRARVAVVTHYTPSPEDLTLNDAQALVANGLTSEQVTNMQYLFFAYKDTAKTVTIDTSSVEPGPHNANSDDPTFSLDFTGNIDDTPFTAVVSYDDLTNVQLVISDPQGHQLFSENSANSSN